MQYDDDVAFQRAIMASPDDVTLKLVYADWLQDRSDPRADAVRLQVECGRAGEPWEAAPFRERLAELCRRLDPAWVAFMTTLAQPFEPITFQEGEPGHPFTEPVGHRGTLVTFESQYRAAADWSNGLLADLAFLAGVEWGDCFYGAVDYPISGFVCELPGTRVLLSDVLSALKVADFRSDGVWPDTIQIHTSFIGQYMFEREGDGSEDVGAHGLLKRYVTGGRLWYVLLHIGGRPCDMVTLLSVGQSPHGKRLVGAITSQACHNLCD